MIQALQSVLKNLDHQIENKYETTLGRISDLRHVYDSESTKTFLSGKLEAYEEMSMLIKGLL